MVPGNRNNVVLKNLDADTPYDITVTAMYADGAGGQLEGDGRTGTSKLILTNADFLKDTKPAPLRETT